MTTCPGLHPADVFQIVLWLLGFLVLLALVTAVRRGDGVIRGIGAQERGKRSSLGFAALAQAAVPVIVLGIEVLQLSDVLHSTTTSNGSHIWIVEVIDHCFYEQSAKTNGDSLLLAWMVPYVIVVLLLLIAISRAIFADVLRLVILPHLTESARASGPVGLSREINHIGLICIGVKDACCDAFAASVVALLAMHVSIIQITLRGMSCCFNQSRCELNGGVAPWSFLTFVAVLLNIVVPACGFAKLVMWRSGKAAAQFRHGPLQRRRRALFLTTSFIPCEPWLLWQLMGNLFAVVGFELAFTWDGNERARWLSLALVQLVFFFQLMILIWPRWLLDAPLLRFNIALRVSLLAAVCFHSLAGYHDSDIAWPLRMVIFFAVIRTLLSFYDNRTASITRLGIALLRKCGLKADAKTTVIDAVPGSTVRDSPLFSLARDMSQISLFFVLTDPTKFPTFCEDLSVDERACFMSASELVTTRLLTSQSIVGPPLHEGASTFLRPQHATFLPNMSDGSEFSRESRVDVEIRRSTVDLISAAMSEDILSHSTYATCDSEQSNASYDKRSNEERQDWVAPLPLLESDQEDKSSAGKNLTGRRAGKEKKDPMLTKKWLLDHFIPAANGPEFMDALPLGASAITPTTSADNIISASSPTRARPRWSSSDNILFRHPVTSTSAEELLKVNSKTASDIMSMNSSVSRVRSFRSPVGSVSSCNSAGKKTGLELFTPGSVFDLAEFSSEEKSGTTTAHCATTADVKGGSDEEFSSAVPSTLAADSILETSLGISSESSSPKKQPLRHSSSGSDISQTSKGDLDRFSDDSSNDGLSKKESAPGGTNASALPSPLANGAAMYSSQDSDQSIRIRGTGPVLPEVYKNLLTVAPSNSLLQLFGERFIKPSKRKQQARGTSHQLDPTKASVAVDKSTPDNVSLNIKIAEPEVHVDSSVVVPASVVLGSIEKELEEEVNSGNCLSSCETGVPNTSQAENDVVDDNNEDRNSEFTNSGEVSNSASVRSPCSAASSKDTVQTRDLLLQATQNAEERPFKLSSSSLPVVEEPEPKQPVAVCRGSVKYTPDEYAAAQARLQAALDLANASMTVDGDGQGPVKHMVLENAALDDSRRPSTSIDDIGNVNMAEAVSKDEAESPEKWSAWKARKEAKKANSRAKYGDWLRGMADGYGGVGALAKTNP